MRTKSTHPLLETARESRNAPGIYRMLGHGGEVLYVGKSKAVRTRLLSYFRARRGEKGHRVIEEAQALNWEYHPSEFAALLRELELIKLHRPRLNVRHRRDGVYSFLKLGGEGPARLTVTRRVGDDAAEYYGPFRGGRRIAAAVRELNDVLGLRDCAADTPMRFADQPDLFGFVPTPRCHRLEMRICAGPCAGGCTRDEYVARVATARAFLDGAADEPIRRLRARMVDASERLNFEYAAVLRDRLGRLERLREEFARLREALDGLTFAYTVPGYEGADRVYLVRRGTIRTVVPAPTTQAERRRLRRLRRETFGAPEPRSTVVPRHQVDEILLVAHWFRTHPGELKRTAPPGARLAAARSA